MTEISGQVMFARAIGAIFIFLGAYIIYRVVRFHRDGYKDETVRRVILRKGRK